jgi:hypothetical protein
MIFQGDEPGAAPEQPDTSQQTRTRIKFRNPWIDPRILDVQPDAAQAYLRRQGWKFLGPAANPDLLLFAGPGDGETPTVLVPLAVEQGPDVQRMIDLVTELAVVERRFTGDVLTDLLRPLSSDPPNGTGQEQARAEEHPNP